MSKPFLRLTSVELLADIFTRTTAYWAWCKETSRYYKIGLPITVESTG